MKNKIISLLLVVIMLFSLASCALPPLGSTDTGSGETGSGGSNTGSSQTTGSGGTSDGTTDDNQTVTPSYFPDKIKYEATTTPDGTKINYTSNYSVFAPEFTKYYHGYKAALSMTFDDGYELTTGQIVSDEFEKYGIFRGTAMLWVSCINNDTAINTWNSVFARGYMDAGCHSWSHDDPRTAESSTYEHEIKDAIEWLRLKFPGQRVLTYAAPLAQMSDPYMEYLDDLVISNRMEGNGTNNVASDSFNIYYVSAVSNNTRTSSETIKSKLNEAVTNGNWMVELFHGVKPTASDLDMSESAFKSHVYYLYSNYRDDIWFGSFEDVSVYIKQCQNAKIKYTACDRESLTFTIESPLDKEIYNIPMSMKVYLPNFVDSAYATVNGEYQPLTVSKDYNKGGALYVTVLDIPVNDAEVKVYIGGNKQYRNGCGTHIYVINEVVEPTHDSLGYTEKICSRCDHTYKLLYTSTFCDFTGEVEEVCATTDDMLGYSKVYCTHCDKFKVVKTYTLE
ncbi:MAG: polysaccharide deacetylase family protein [Clostridia bacterium]|nr:polysaccharide deacetylase family protein [Clostridia bacterium]